MRHSLKRFNVAKNLFYQNPNLNLNSNQNSGNPRVTLFFFPVEEHLDASLRCLDGPNNKIFGSSSDVRWTVWWRRSSKI